MELRQDYGDANAGTCWESVIGGDHFRWVDDYKVNARLTVYLVHSARMVLPPILEPFSLRKSPVLLRIISNFQVHDVWPLRVSREGVRSQKFSERKT